MLNLWRATKQFNVLRQATTHEMKKIKPIKHDKLLVACVSDLVMQRDVSVRLLLHPLSKWWRYIVSVWMLYRMSRMETMMPIMDNSNLASITFCLSLIITTGNSQSDYISSPNTFTLMRCCCGICHYILSFTLMMDVIWLIYWANVWIQASV